MWGCGRLWEVVGGCWGLLGVARGCWVLGAVGGGWWGVVGGCWMPLTADWHRRLGISPSPSAHSRTSCRNTPFAAPRAVTVVPLRLRTAEHPRSLQSSSKASLHPPPPPQRGIRTPLGAPCGPRRPLSTFASPWHACGRAPAAHSHSGPIQRPIPPADSRLPRAGQVVVAFRWDVQSNRPTTGVAIIQKKKTRSVQYAL